MRDFDHAAEMFVTLEAARQNNGPAKFVIAPIVPPNIGWFKAQQRQEALAAGAYGIGTRNNNGGWLIEPL